MVGLQIAALTAFLAIACILYMTLRFVRPLRAMMDAMREVPGDVAREIRVAGPSELAELAAAANRMRQDLAGLLDERDAQRDRLATALSRQHETERLKDELAARVAHDLRAPLAAIIGYARLLDDPRTRDRAEERHRCLDAVARSARVLQLLAGNLLHNVRLEGERLETRREAFPPRDLADEVVQMLDPLIQEGGAQTVNRIPADLRVRADREMVRSVLMNLVSNALRHTAAGGRLVLDARGDGGKATVAVRDNGCGIAAGNLEKLFRKFEPLEGIRRGTGLGLFIVRSILAAHGETVDVTSRPGEGTCVTFTLAQAPAEAALKGVSPA